MFGVPGQPVPSLSVIGAIGEFPDLLAVRAVLRRRLGTGSYFRVPETKGESLEQISFGRRRQLIAGDIGVQRRGVGLRQSLPLYG